MHDPHSGRPSFASSSPPKPKVYEDHEPHPSGAHLHQRGAEQMLCRMHDGRCVCEVEVEGDLHATGGNAPQGPPAATTEKRHRENEERDAKEVCWDEDDPENPQNWSSRRKAGLTLLCASLTLVA